MLFLFLCPVLSKRSCLDMYWESSMHRHSRLVFAWVAGWELFAHDGPHAISSSFMKRPHLWLCLSSFSFMVRSPCWTSGWLKVSSELKLASLSLLWSTSHPWGFSFLGKMVAPSWFLTFLWTGWTSIPTPTPLRTSRVHWQNSRKGQRWRVQRRTRCVTFFPGS